MDSCGEVAEGEMIGTPACAATDSVTARVIEEASGPDDRADAFDLDQAAGFLGCLRGVESGIADDQLDRVSEHAASVVEVLDGEFDAGLDGGAELGQRAGEVGQEADLERLVGDGRSGRLVLLILLLGGGGSRLLLVGLLLLLGDRLLLLLLFIIVAAGREEAKCQRDKQQQGGGSSEIRAHGQSPFRGPATEAGPSVAAMLGNAIARRVGDVQRMPAYAA